MVLAVILVSAAGAEIQLCSAVGAVEEAGEHAGSSCFCRPAFVFPRFLYPFPLSLLNDGGLGVLKKPLVLNRVFHPLFEFQGLGIGLEVYGTARVLPTFQYPDDRFCAPLIKILRHGPAFLPGVIGGNGQHPVGCEDFGDLHGAFSGNAEVEDALYHLCRFFVHDPLLFILRVFYVPIGRIAGKMLPCFAPRLYHCSRI